MIQLFGSHKQIEAEIDEFLDQIIGGGLLFKKGIKFYLDGREEEFEQRLNELILLEKRADDLRRDIETKLYTKTLIPEFRGDVLGLLEHSDAVLNQIADTLLEFSVERPETLDDLRDLKHELAKNAIKASEFMVKAIRCYFRDLSAVRDNIKQVHFSREETNRLSEKYKREIFGRGELRLSHKMHLRYFARSIENIADDAEDLCDRLAIAAIKRYI
ncbi:hypothetical protein CYPRO_1464 [Cyclonatronum proteinivorum]|uniref:TIGR00153 family protein n=1 Tax=Cyclonatronum proteinivorum TaxID=1457365 RepID=A0A345UJR8_9BACT|nr:DUF47 family protein [Cyclonatronum proteinivorum]AXJ00720.1 hypothetical protein CYPRO_1464 [Cyclonatronum proteinivorum]